MKKRAPKFPVVFVDRDGTILKEPADHQVDELSKMEYVPGIISGLKLLQASGFRLVLVSNQDGLGKKSYPRKSFELVQGKMLRLLAGEGVRFEEIFICPHFVKDGCRCRKPLTSLVERYLRKSQLDLARSFVLGDRETDVVFARNLGVGAVRLLDRGVKANETEADFATSSALDACEWISGSLRRARFERSTAETRILAEVRLGGLGRYDVETGIPFFDHMIEQLARHSGIDITLKAQGDLEIDAHHTVEDVGIVLGKSIRQALGQKRGIRRYGFVVPMDEARAEVSMDLSGRGHLEFEAHFRRAEIGGLPTELVEDFFIAFAGALEATLHIRSVGRNDHHRIESIFKAVARALRTAIEIEEKFRAEIPSTKGSL